MFAVQSPGSRRRGIGRYGHHLTASLLERGGGHDFVLYAHEGLPDDLVPTAPNAEARALRRGGAPLRDVMTRLTSDNPDGPAAGRAAIGGGRLRPDPLPVPGPGPGGPPIWGPASAQRAGHLHLRRV